MHLGTATGSGPTTAARPTGEPVQTPAAAERVEHASAALETPAGFSLFAAKLSMVSIFWGAGAGLVVPFFNVYFTRRFGASPAVVGAILSWNSAVGAVGALLSALVSQRLGRVGTVCAAAGDRPHRPGHLRCSRPVAGGGPGLASRLSRLRSESRLFQPYDGTYTTKASGHRQQPGLHDLDDGLGGRCPGGRGHHGTRELHVSILAFVSLVCFHGRVLLRVFREPPPRRPAGWRPHNSSPYPADSRRQALNAPVSLMLSLNRAQELLVFLEAKHGRARSLKGSRRESRQRR